MFCLKNSHCTFPGPDSLSWPGWRWGCWTARKSSSKGNKTKNYPTHGVYPPKKIGNIYFSIQIRRPPSGLRHLPRGPQGAPVHGAVLQVRQNKFWSSLKFFNTNSLTYLPLQTQKNVCKKIHVGHRKGKTSTRSLSFHRSKKITIPKSIEINSPYVGI